MRHLIHDVYNRSLEMVEMTIETLVNEFLEYLEIEKNYSQLTIRQYKHYLFRFIEWLTDNSITLIPENVNKETIRKYRLYLSRMPSQYGDKLSKLTQNYHIIAIRSFLRYLTVKRDINTLSPEKVDLPKQKSRQINFLNIDRINKLLNSPNILDKAGLRDRAILETLFSTGLRVSELVSLNKDQIDLKSGEFGIKGKGNKIRIVFLSDSAIYWIKRYLKARDDNFKPLFIHYGGRKDEKKEGERMRLTPRSVQRIVAKYAKRCSLPIKVSPHTMRHSFATDLLIGGADIRSVQEMLGHESIRTTQEYTHVTNRHLKEIHKKYHSEVEQERS
jgi:site-specific recombinase XerD